MMVQPHFFLALANDLSPLHFEHFLLFTNPSPPPPNPTISLQREWPHLAPRREDEMPCKMRRVPVFSVCPHPPLRPRGSLLKVGQDENLAQADPLKNAREVHSFGVCVGTGPGLH